MLPLAGVSLLVAFLPARDPRRTARALLAAGLALGLVVAPFAAALSLQKGRLTFGDTGRLNYAWFVNGAPAYDWQGKTPGLGTPKHPTQLIYPSPPVYAFARPVIGTYPVWTDPSYWNEGLRPRFNARQQARAVLKNLGLSRLTSSPSPRARAAGAIVLVGGALLLLLTVAAAAQPRIRLNVRGDLLLIAIVPVILYGLVVVHARYVGASVVLLGLALLPVIRLPARPRSQSRVILTTLLILLVPAVGLARASVRNIQRRTAGRADWETATALHALGIQPGDRVGCIGLSLDLGWARLARVSVTAQILTGSVDDYWSASPPIQAAVLRAFAQAGARAVVADNPPAGRAARGWQRLGCTNRYACLLRPPSPSSLASRGTIRHAHG
jgi:hypothetical protein